MKLDRSCELEARLPLNILPKVKEGLQLETLLAGLDKRAHHVRIALYLAYIRNSLPRNVLLHRFGQNRRSLRGQICLLLLLSGTFLLLVDKLLLWLLFATTLFGRVGRGLLFVLGRLEELPELLVDGEGHGGEVAVVLPPQMPLQLLNLLVQVPQVEFGLFIQL